MATILYTPKGRSRFTCAVEASDGSVLILEGGLGSSDRISSGKPELTDNPAVVLNAWAYAENEALYRRSRSTHKREVYRKQREHHSDLTLAITEMAIRPGSRTRLAWCSCCLTTATHTEP